jgi:hypothetical protein
MKKPRIRTWIGLAVSVCAFVLAPVDWRAAVILGCVGMAIGVLNLWTAE